MGVIFSVNLANVNVFIISLSTKIITLISHRLSNFCLNVCVETFDGGRSDIIMQQDIVENHRQNRPKGNRLELCKSLG